MSWKIWWRSVMSFFAGRWLAALGLAAWMTLAVLPIGCSRLTVTSVQQASMKGHPLVPHITEQRLKGCVEDYGRLLEPGYHVFRPKVETDRDGYMRNVTADDIPKSAYDFAACTRIVLREMTIPEWILNYPGTLASDSTTVAQRSYVGIAPVVVAGVTIVFTDLVIQAGGITILFAIAVEVVNDAVEMVRRRRRWENDCDAHRTECLMSNIADQPGGLFKHTLCHMCREFCVKSEGQWPSEIERFDGTKASCAYWRHTGN